MDIQNIPIALYIHIPWCIKKCPYCDFNSHKSPESLPEIEYVTQLLKELDQKKHLLAGREISSIFIGGGTPSLFSAKTISILLGEIKNKYPLKHDIEITLEANPGTLEYDNFSGYRKADVNRLSIGVQSFNTSHLKRLGRIHDDQQATNAINNAKQSGFDNLNIDIMFGLPQQTQQQALSDLQQAIELNPTHISWYQLTLEPNTLFHRNPPPLPPDETIWTMQQTGQSLLADKGYGQYEVSAYCKLDHQCQHNLNYWLFGDYIGIGAGAHSKVTTQTGIYRHSTIKHPKAYLKAGTSFNQTQQKIKASDLPLEFMLNTLRLEQTTSTKLYQQRTGQPISNIKPNIDQAIKLGFIEIKSSDIKTTPLGKRFLNDLLMLF